MHKITSAADLKTAIHLLEEENKINGQKFRHQIFITYQNLKPLNIIKSSFHGISPSITDEISGTGLGLLGGFLSRKIFVGTSGNIIRKLIGTALQLGVTAVVSQNSVLINTAGFALFQLLKSNRNKVTTRITE